MTDCYDRTPELWLSYLVSYNTCNLVKVWEHSFSSCSSCYVVSIADCNSGRLSLGGGDWCHSSYLQGASYWNICHMVMKYHMYNQIQKFVLLNLAKYQTSSKFCQVLLIVSQVLFNHKTKTQHSYCHSQYLSYAYGKKNSYNLFGFFIGLF